MKFKIAIYSYLLLGYFGVIFSQSSKEFIRVEYEGFKFPVLVRGNLKSGKILLFVQGGPGETSIDFARADYPHWKNSLEEVVAIAYYDQRGLNQKVKKIDSASITYEQYAEDIRFLARHLGEKYNADIYLIGHSVGGRFVLHALDGLEKNETNISGAIIANTPYTNGYSRSRYNYYRPLYLKNLAMEKIEQGIDTSFWRQAYNWMDQTDTIYDRESSMKWNYYVDQAFEASRRRITPGMVMKTVFSRPYNPFRYLYRKDNERVGDLLWIAEEAEKQVHEMDISLPVLMITGRYDDIAPPEEMNAMEKELRHSKILIIPEAGHESFLDQPKIFTESILKFIHQ